MSLLKTPRLLLRAPILADATRIAQFVGDLDVARMLQRVPHPYAEADARWWIGTQLTPQGRAIETVFVATLDGNLIGACSHLFGEKPTAAEIGYWVGKPYWGNGYGTEMAAALVRYGFAAYGLDSTTVSHMIDNPASAAIIAKLGFRPTGRRRTHCVARDAEVDVLTYRLTKAEAEDQTWYKAACRDPA